MNIYYVYQYLREKDSTTALVGTPYYIGKGKNNRAYIGHNNRIPSNKDYIQIIKDNLTEQEAMDLEILLIEKYGRKDLGTGILINLSNGGEGASGAIRSQEHKIRISQAQSGKIVSDVTKERLSKALLGKKRSNIAKENISKAHIGQVAWNKGLQMTEDWKANRPWHTCETCGLQSQNLTNIKRFHNSNCKNK